MNLNQHNFLSKISTPPIDYHEKINKVLSLLNDETLSWTEDKFLDLLSDYSDVLNTNICYPNFVGQEKASCIYQFIKNHDLLRFRERTVEMFCSRNLEMMKSLSNETYKIIMNPKNYFCIHKMMQLLPQSVFNDLWIQKHYLMSCDFVIYHLISRKDSSKLHEIFNKNKDLRKKIAFLKRSFDEGTPASIYDVLDFAFKNKDEKLLIALNAQWKIDIRSCFKKYSKEMTPDFYSFLKENFNCFKNTTPCSTS